MKAYKFLWLPLIALVGFTFTSCEEEERVGMQDEPEKAKIAIFNAVTPTRPTPATNPNLLGMYFNLDGRQLYTAPLITNKTTGYFLADPGARSLRIDTTRATMGVGTNANFPTGQVLNTSLNVEAGKFYSLYLTGKVQAPEQLFLTDDLTRPAAGKALVRFVHIAPDAAGLDIAAGLNSVAGAPPVLFSNRTYKTATAFTPINPGLYKVQVRNTGVATALPTFTANQNVTPTFVQDGSSRTEFTINLEEGKIYTMAVKGYVNPATAGQGANPLSVGTVFNLYW